MKGDPLAFAAPPVLQELAELLEAADRAAARELALATQPRARHLAQALDHLKRAQIELTLARQHR